MFASGQVVSGRSVNDFVTVGNQCWISFSNRLARLDLDPREKNGIELPGRGEANPTCLAQGTDSLWIGYGQGYQRVGGFGRLDLKTGKIRNWIPALPASVGGSESVRHDATPILDPPDGPPRNRVVGIARGGPNTLWIAVARKGLQKFDTTPPLPQSRCTAMWLGSAEQVSSVSSTWLHSSFAGSAPREPPASHASR